MDRELRTQARLSKRTLTTQADIGNTVYGTEVHSVNGKVGHVVLDAGDVGALPSDTPIPSLDGYATEEWVGEQGYATLADIPTDVSAFNNDAGYLSDTLYPVVITQVSEDDDTRYTADKTFAEVRDAYNAGMIPVIVWKGAFININAVTNSTINFARVSGSSFYQFNYRSDRDVIVRSKISMAKTSDIPSNVSQLTNDAGYLTQHQDLSDYALKSELPTVPTNVSAFTNDAGYLSDAYFVITATADDDTATVYTPDCTLAEAWTAFQSGKTLLLKLGSVYIPSGFTSSALIRFSTFNGTYNRDYTFNNTRKIEKTSETRVLSEAYYLVTVTQNGSTYTANHTYAEVNEAYQSGKIPLLSFNDSLIPMQYCKQGMATFTKVIAYSYHQFTLISQNNYKILFTTIPLARQSDVYTKTEIDSKIGDIETLLQGI